MKQVIMLVPERLKRFREKKKLTHEEMGDFLGISRQGYGNYENGKREPDHETMGKLADFFNTTIDYLQGRTDDPSPTSTQAPDWATSRDKRDIKKILDEDLPVMFDGKPVDEEDRQRITDLITGFLWESKEKNKKTYGRKKDTQKNTSDDN